MTKAATTKTTKTSLNWFQKAIGKVTIEQKQAKVDEILQACSISLPTYYLWLRTGHIPRKCDEVKICQILKCKAK